ncbi:MAG: stage II sporulation protein P [Lachnospiraceae bacterium]|nr:stage II sporulation protein P [Lachnospiraceae bacterium]
MKKLKVDLIYQITSLLLGVFILVKGIGTFGGAESIDIIRDTLTEEAVYKYLGGIRYTATGNDNITTETFVLHEIYNHVPVFQYMVNREDIDVESKDFYDFIKWREGTDEDYEEEMPSDKEEEGQVKVEDKEAEEELEGEEDEPIPETVSLEKLKDFDYLISHYYSIDKTTTINSEQLNVDNMLKEDFTIKKDTDNPQILIYHTHSQEAFSNSIQGDADMTVVGLGNQLAGYLEEYGYHVYHDTTTYDLENRDYAYAKAEPAIPKILEQYPSIEVIIDIHRDGVKDSTHLVETVNGKRTAQFMFFNGLSRTTANGDIKDLENPYIKDNLAFSFQLQMKANQYYPGIARNIYLKGLRYNMHFKPKSLLVEIGAQTNTFEEASNAIEPLADVLNKVLSGE